MGKKNSEYKIIDGKHCFSTQAVCQILIISRQTLNEWEKDGCPKEERGWWCICDVLKWRGLVGNGVKTTGEAKAVKEKVSLSEQKLQAEAELKQAQLEALKIKNDIANGKYLNRDLAVADLKRFCNVLKKSLMNLKNKLGVEIAFYLNEDDAKILLINIEEVIQNALTQLSVTGIYGR